MVPIKRWTIRAAALFAAAMMVSASTARASLVISFDQFSNTAGGMLSYDGAGGALVGEDIVFDTVRLFDTDTNTILASASCAFGLPCMELDFQTGTNTLDDGTHSTYAWGGDPVGGNPDNNYFTLTLVVDGGILGMSAGTVILDGSTSSASFGPQVVGGQVTYRANVAGIDVKNPELLEFLFTGLGAPPTNFQFLNSETIVVAANFHKNPDGSFTANPTNADIDNTEFVPEPGSALLLLLGLGSLAAYRRRR